MNSKKENIINNKSKPYNTTSSDLFLPTMILFTLLITTSYVFDYIYSGGHTSILGEATAFSSILFGTGQILYKLSFVLLSVGIANSVAGIRAIPGAIAGSILSTEGVAFSSISGSMAGVPGVFGYYIIGIISGKCTILCNKKSEKDSNKEQQKSLLNSLIPIAITIIIVLALNSVSMLINSFSSSLLTVLADTKSIILPLILGVMTIIDGGGPLYMCAYIFGVTSISAKEPQVMAAVVAAGMIPPLACGLFAYIFKERFDKKERQTAFLGLIPAIFGLPQISYHFYISKKYRFLLPCIVGSSISSLLSILLDCSVTTPYGGIISFSTQSRPLFLIVCIVFGVLVTTALMSLTIKDPNKLSDTAENSPLPSIIIAEKSI